MLTTWGFGRWQIAATKMKLRSWVSPKAADGRTIENLDTVELSPEQMDVMMLMADVVIPLHDQLDLTTLLEDACMLAKWLLRCTHAAPVLKTLDMASSSCYSLTKTTGEVLPNGQSLIHHTAATGKSMLCNGVSGETLFNPLIDRLCAVVNSMLLVPIQVPGKALLGLLVLSKSKDGEFGQSDQFLIEILCSHLACAASKL